MLSSQMLDLCLQMLVFTLILDTRKFCVHLFYLDKKCSQYHVASHQIFCSITPFAESVSKPFQSSTHILINPPSSSRSQS